VSLSPAETEKVAAVCREFISSGNAESFAAAFCAACAKIYPKRSVIVAARDFLLAAMGVLAEEERLALARRLSEVPDFAQRIRAEATRHLRSDVPH